VDTYIPVFFTWPQLEVSSQLHIPSALTSGERASGHHSNEFKEDEMDRAYSSMERREMNVRFRRKREKKRGD
jgi:hypothetical protein